MSNNDFPEDTFTENDILRSLDQAGLRYKNGPKYIISQCPTHEDSNPSTQIFKDDWFVNCLAGCGRYHITKAFPQLLPADHPGNTGSTQSSLAPKTRPAHAEDAKVNEPKYQEFNLFPDWEKMPLIPRDHNFKGVPLDELDELGWRWDAAKNSYFIPYFDRSKQFIPFAQWRHLTGDRRFTFLKDAKPIAYGMWNLDERILFVVEGTSDFAVLNYCMIPAIAMPSASSGTIMKGLAGFCKQNGITIVYAGDNDSAGDKLREALDEVVAYRVKQPPKKYKDWGDFFVAESQDAVHEWCRPEIFPGDPKIDEAESLAAVQAVWPDAQQLEMVSGPQKKEQPIKKGPLGTF
jgi:hypothetical protein